MSIIDSDRAVLTPAQQKVAAMKQQALEKNSGNALALMPDKIVILCDVSISMETTFGKLSRVKAAERGMKSIINTSNAKNTAYALYTYDDNAHLIHPMGTPYSKFNLTELYACGNTSIYNALVAGMSQNPTRMILLSDGEDWNTSIRTYCEGEIKSKSVKVDTIAIGEPNSTLMMDIANITGGVFRVAKDDDELNAIFLSFEPSNYAQLEHHK